MIHKTTRSILSVLLAALLLVTSIPLTPAFADGGAVSPPSESGEGRALEPAADGKYYISTAEQLEEFAKLVNNKGETTANAVLTDDINLNPDMKIDEDGKVTNGSELDQWTPIGNEDHRYTGTFDGNGHTISGLYINNSTADDQGLFGYVSGTVKNLSVSGSVKGDDYVGGVVGQNRGSVENCYNTGAVNSSGNRVGGVVGYNSRIVKNCYNTGAVNSSGNWVGGVVGVNSGSVTNCYNTGNISGNISGNSSDNHVGGVVGYNNGGTVENCYNTGKVSGPDSGNISGYSYVGGVVGLNRGTVENCYNTGTVSSNSNTSDVGGVVGCNGGTVDNRGTVENCYNTGKVTGSNVGGVVGYNYIGGSVTNCYNTGEVSGKRYVGGVAGGNSSSGNVTGCYFLQQDGVNENLPGIGGDSAEGAKSLTADQFKKQENFTDWEFGIADTDTWKIEPIFGRPTLKANAEIGGTANNPYKIFTATQLENFRDLVNGKDGNPAAWAVLMENITLNSNEEWEPIGIISQQYSGTFDGNGHTISGLYIDSSGVDYKGLFGYVYGGTVQDLTVSGDINGYKYVGGIVGYNNGGNVTGCTFSGSGSVSGSYYVGGIVGYNGTGATVSNCYNTGTGTVTGNDYVGGVVGQNSSSGTVKNCYNTGSVTSSGIYVGGVVGQNLGGTVENCYNTRTVSGSDYVGGVVGDNISSTVENCYNTGTVTSSGNSVGGVVGYNYGGRVENCYNTGSVSDGTTSGGVVGQNSGSVTNCYFLQQNGVPAQGIGSGSVTSSNVEARTAAAFHSGEVAWRLQNGQTAGAGEPIPLVWGQSKLGETTSLPTLNPTDEQKVYQVTFDYGDSFTDNDKHYAYSYTNGVVSEPTKNPELAGHTLSGWYSDESLTTAWDFSTAVTENMTLYAKWTAVEEPDPEPEEPPYTGKYSYEIATDIGDNGAISVDRYATEGDKVTIDVTPDQAYKLDDLSVTAGGKEVTLTANSDGTYTFTMPSADVKITATFAEDPDWTEPEEPATDVSDLFIDIAPDAWYKDAVQYAYDNGLMTGVSATEFDPEATTTRAMIVSILARLEGVTTAQAAGFADVNDEWYATAVNWAANVGVVNGYEDNTFRPNTAITREQLAAILMNYAAYKGYDVSARADLSHYSDADSISSWANDVLLWAVAEGLLTGVTDDTIAPQAHATRAQVAAILQRFLSE